MKKIILFFVAVHTITISFCQKIDSTYGYSMTDVVKTDLTVKDLYSKSKEWFAIIFKSSQDVIQADIPMEKIVGKGIMVGTISIPIDEKLYTTTKELPVVITLEFKEGRYKYNFEFNQSPTYYSEDYFKNYNDSVLLITPGGKLVGKKKREEMVKTQLFSQDQTNNLIHKKIDELKVLLLSFLSKKPSDNW